MTAFPSIRLAYHPEGDRTLSMLKTDEAPAVRLAVAPVGERLKGKGGANSVKHHTEKAGLGHPTVRLAHVDGAQGDCVLKGQKGVAQLSEENAPPLLVSFFYIKPFLANQSKYRYRDWVMDSGAFSAYASGVSINFDEYIALCKKLLAEDPTLTEIFALDVIGDHAASELNCVRMWEEGIPAIPCYHYGEPESVLMEMAEKYPKIAIGGCARMRMKQKMNFAEQCFARVWPKKIHGFGFGSEESIMALPFHSVDATNWEMGPCAFGRWNKFGVMSVRGSNQNLKQEVEFYLEVERRARIRWRREMAQLEEISGEYPIVRLAAQLNPRIQKALIK